MLLYLATLFVNHDLCLMNGKIGEIMVNISLREMCKIRVNMTITGKCFQVKTHHGIIMQINVSPLLY